MKRALLAIAFFLWVCIPAFMVVDPLHLTSRLDLHRGDWLLWIAVGVTIVFSMYDFS